MSKARELSDFGDGLTVGADIGVEVNDPEMGTYTYEEHAPIEGFHANLRMREELTDEQKALLPLIEKPSTPVRIWAGDE